MSRLVEAVRPFLAYLSIDESQVSVEYNFKTLAFKL